jgi:tripartite-type tricarboxylate transporter receptor subunit TctC
MRAVGIALAIVSSLGFMSGAQSQSYPARPIRVIVPFTAGDTVDILARLVGQKLTESLNQQVINDNRPGATGMLGLDLAARATPDGYTIALGQGGNLVIAPHTQRKPLYDPVKDFAAVAQLVSNGLVLVVNPSSPFKNTRDLVDYAKANPGKLTFASNGEGGFVHLSFERLRQQTGFTYTHIPYKGLAPSLTDLMSGQVMASMATLVAVGQHVKSGKLRILGTTNPTRAPQIPDIPAIAESFPGYESRGWFGFVAPAATPRTVVALLNREINKAMGMADVEDKIVAAGFTIDTGTPDYFAATIRSDYAKYGKLIRDIRLQLQ